VTLARRLLPLLALSGGLILLHQLGDLAAATAGVDLGIPAGRVKFVVTAIGRAAGLITADVLLVAAALGLGRRGLLRALAVVHALVGLVLLVWAPLFMSDTGGLASAIGGAELTAYRLTVVRTLIMVLALGLTGLRAGWLLGGIHGGERPDAAA
jgi:hypothetical protein